MVTCGKDKYYPSEQGEIFKWDFQTKTIIPKDSKGDWAKYAAEDMLFEVALQMQKYEKSQ